MKMTKVDALNVALSTLTADTYEVKHDAVFADGTPTIATEIYTQQEVREIFEKMIAQLSKPRKMSDEAKAKAYAKRKEQNAAKRAEMCAQVVPILREVMTTDMTAKEIFTAAQERLPQDFTVNKVQYILLNEMKDEVVKTETKGKANTYTLR